MATSEAQLRPATSAHRLGADHWVARIGDGAAVEDLHLLAGHGGPLPASARDDRAVVAVDGTLSDVGALARAVGAPASESAPELVLRAYRRFGDEMLDHLRGVFAVLVWDAERRRLLAARDQMGLHPLFYARAGGELYLSSSIHALLAHDAVPSDVNRAALADHLAHHWPDPGETYFAAVRRVPPGHALRRDGGGMRLERYWDPVPPGEEPDWVRPDEMERFGELLDQAVDRGLAHGPSAILLSGGLDSVSVGATATDRARAQGMDDPLALSLGFPDPECNEEPVQREVADALGIDQIMLGFEEALPEDGLLASAIALAAERPAPVISYWTPAYLRVASEGRLRGREVVFSGHGGDEWLTVSPYYAADLWRSGDVRGLLRLGATQQRSFPVAAHRLWSNLVWRFGTKALLRSAARGAAERWTPGALGAYRARGARRRPIPDWIAPDPRLRTEVRERGVARRPAGDRSPYMTELRTALDHPLTSLELEEIFENGRSVGMSFVPPYLDTDLVDFLYRTPPHLLDANGWSKGLVRDRLARRFPDSGFGHQRKMAATSYARSVMRDHVAREWDRMGGVPALVELGVATRDGLLPMLAAAAAGDYPSQFRVWDALNLESWLRSHL
jgi:asparagine synthetase B (glutamine-hydrolysing)